MKKSIEPVRIAVIGGSGLYEIKALKDARAVRIRTPFGYPSDSIHIGRISQVPVAFLPRHGRGHRLLPSEIPQRANMYALKSIGVDTVISISAVGSLREELAPRHFVFPDQLVDETKGRVSTFFGSGIAAHVGMADPFCSDISNFLYERSLALGITSHKGGTYVCMEGPAFSTKAESEYHRKMGYSIIGMTASPEAKLAREAGLCYAPVSLVTDYDVWKEGQEVSAARVFETLKFNIDNVRKLIVDAIRHFPTGRRACNCREMMKSAVFTKKEAIPRRTFAKLRPLLKGNI